MGGVPERKGYAFSQFRTIGIAEDGTGIRIGHADPDQPVGAGGVCRQPVLRHPLEFRRGRGDAAGILGDIPVEAADSVVDAILQLGDPLDRKSNTSELQSLMRNSYAVL